MATYDISLFRYNPEFYTVHIQAATIAEACKLAVTEAAPADGDAWEMPKYAADLPIVCCDAESDDPDEPQEAVIPREFSEAHQYGDSLSRAAPAMRVALQELVDWDDDLNTRAITVYDDPEKLTELFALIGAARKLIEGMTP